MNRLRFGFLGLGLLLAVSAAQAQETRVKASIPFDFVVGNQVLPSGDYMVVSQGSANEAILIRSDDNKAVSLSLTYACSSFNPSDKTKLVFHSVKNGRRVWFSWWRNGTAGRPDGGQCRIVCPPQMYVKHAHETGLVDHRPLHD